jgi:hypothetical protein
MKICLFLVLLDSKTMYFTSGDKLAQISSRGEFTTGSMVYSSVQWPSSFKDEMIRSMKTAAFADGAFCPK